MSSTYGIRWWRILIGAVVVEILLLAIAAPLASTDKGRAILLAMVVPLCLVGAFLGGWWVAIRAHSFFLLHGLLLGALAALLYGALTWKISLPTAYIVANYLKVLAGAGGGLTARVVLRNQSPLDRRER